MAFNYSDPDKSAQGFLGFTPNPMRYEFYDPSCYGVHNTIASLIPPESSVLEIGCGTAILGDVLKKKGIRLYEGVEPSQKRARASKATPACDFGLTDTHTAMAPFHPNGKSLFYLLHQ